MKLDSYIKEFLILNNNVIVKGFGSFEKVLESAVIDEKSGEIHPPHMTIKFDETLKIDSGSLSKFIAVKEKKAEQDIVKQIIEQVNNWNVDIKAGKHIDLDGIGIVSQDHTGKKKFEAKIKSGTFPDMYGLPILSIEESNKPQQKIQQDVSKKPIDKKQAAKNDIPAKKTIPQKKTVKKVSEPIKKLKQTKQDSYSDKQTKKVMVIALVAVPILIIIILGALNFDFVKEKFNDSSEYVSNLLSGNNDGSEAIQDVDTNEASNISILDSTQNQTEAVLENYTIINAETNESVAAKTENLTNFSKIEVIAGSFKSKRNAKRFRNQLNNKGFSSKVLARSNGLYRVSVGSFNDANQAANEMANIKDIDANLNVWVLLNN